MVRNVFYCVESDEQLSRYGHQQKCDCTFSVCPSVTMYWVEGGGGMGALERLYYAIFSMCLLLVTVLMKKGQSPLHALKV